jgi:hypothetical protein
MHRVSFLAHMSDSAIRMKCPAACDSVRPPSDENSRVMARPGPLFMRADSPPHSRAHRRPGPRFQIAQIPGLDGNLCTPPASRGRGAREEFHRAGLGDRHRAGRGHLPAARTRDWCPTPRSFYTQDHWNSNSPSTASPKPNGLSPHVELLFKYIAFCSGAAGVRRQRHFFRLPSRQPLRSG